MAAQHGEYVEGYGWYDASRRAWLDRQSAVTPVRLTEHRQSPDLGQPIIERKPRAERLTDTAAKGWKPNRELEQLRHLRDSDRVEDRQAAEKFLRGSRRIEMATYEVGLRAYLERGGELPEGVREP